MFPRVQGGGRIEVRLTEDCLYCADDGAPIDENGVRALMFSRLSTKRATSQIGMFGLGFKSVLGVSDKPEFFSRSGSFRFDPAGSRDRIRAGVPGTEHAAFPRFPVLRLPEPIEPSECAAGDDVLRDLMGWAVNIVRLRLKPGAYEDLGRQMREFPSEFLLFVRHVAKLTLTDGSQSFNRVIEAAYGNDEHIFTGSAATSCATTVQDPAARGCAVGLTEGDDTRSWKLFSRDCELSDEASADRRDGEERDRVPVCWAAPFDRLARSSRERSHGRFWAFFPTETSSLVAGVLNAPWKTNEDRQNLLAGPYNEQLIRTAAELIADALPQLASEEDPAGHLDALPRWSETGDNPHAAGLSDSLFSMLSERAVLPDQDGRLRRIRDIRYPPEELSRERNRAVIPGSSDRDEILKSWASYPDRPRSWLHHQAITRNRMSKVDRLFGHETNQYQTGTAKASKASVPEELRTSMPQWLEALVRDKTGDDAVQASKVAIRTAVLIARGRRSPNPAARNTPNPAARNTDPKDLGKIVLTSGEVYEIPDPERIFLPYGDEYTGVSRYCSTDDAADLIDRIRGFIDRLRDDPKRNVHPELAADDTTRSELEELGLKRHSCESVFKIIAEHVLLGSSNDEASNDEARRAFWFASRNVGMRAAYDIIRSINIPDKMRNTNISPSTWSDMVLKGIRVLTRSGDWKRIYHVLSPGEVVSHNSNRDKEFTLDTQFHKPDEKLLELLGMRDKPQEGYDPHNEPSRKAYSEWCDYRYKYRQEYRKLYHTGRDGQRITPQRDKLKFKDRKGLGPLYFLISLSDEGRARYTDALLKSDACYEPLVMRHTGSSTSSQCYDAEKFESFAIHMIREHGRIETDDGIVPFKDALNDPPENYDALKILLKHEKSDKIKEAFDLSDPTPEFSGERKPIPIVDIWPGLNKLMHKCPPLSEYLRSCRLIICDNIKFGHEDLKYIVHDSDVYLAVSTADYQKYKDCALHTGLPITETGINGLPITSTGINGLPITDPPITDLQVAAQIAISTSFTQWKQQLMTSIKRELGWDRQLWNYQSEISELEAVFESIPYPIVRQRRAAIRQCSSDAERLLDAVGEEALREGLPQSLLDVLEDEIEPLTGVDVAEAAISTYHSTALKRFESELCDLDPPKQWAGSKRAVAFVRDLGFSDEWAGERGRRRRSFLEVEGPWPLPPLHDYQRVIADNVSGMLSGGRSIDRLRRGMISLPTGSGKTRVAIQGIVEAISSGAFRGGVLWVAERDELCEQAVQAWRRVWSSMGITADGGRAVCLRISRMWHGQPPPVPADELHVVVATLQTVYSKFSNWSSPTGDAGDEYEFLRRFALVVFDEAHRSISPTSTSVLGELGLTHRRKEGEPFLLGLTATPYRGHDEAETGRLVKRYGGNRLDSGTFMSDDPRDVIGELQDDKVLACADHKIIDGGTFRLSEDDIAEMKKFVRGASGSRWFSRAWLPQSAEDRIAGDSERTKRIIDAYETHVQPDWPTLVFATSVEHAQTTAALLNRKGIRARAVSGETEPTARRRAVREFRDGEIRALVNYAVFREGFDAPKTRAIIVARPVYSPNLYFQMIGRGLRGPKNGGNRRCLILNVQDTIDNFERDLAFTELDWLWHSGP